MTVEEIRDKIFEAKTRLKSGQSIVAIALTTGLSLKMVETLKAEIETKP